MKKEDINCLLKNLCDEYCPSDKYCILKEIIIYTHKFEPRFLIQLKCIEIFKYEESEKLQKALDWDQAFLKWVEDGYAKIFADVYNEKANPRQLYKKILKIKKDTKE